MTTHNQSADGLRGLAALIVTVAHFAGAFLPSLLHKIYPTQFPAEKHPTLLFEIAQSPLGSLFYNGELPVLVFFVLSGYVLTMPYFRGNLDALRARIWGRYLRLNLPIVASLIIAFALYRAGWFLNADAGAATGSQWFAAYYRTNVNWSQLLELAFYKSVVYGDGTLNPPLRTLAVEFAGSIYLLAFYLVKPARFHVLPTLLLCALAYAFHKQASIYYIAMFLGALLNCLSLKRGVALAALTAGFYFGCFQFENPIYNFLPNPRIFEVKQFYDTLGAFLITLAVVNGVGRVLLASRAAQFLGRISFSLYLIHFSVLASVTSAIYLRLGPAPLNFTATFAAYLCLSIGAAWLLQRYIDRPAIFVSHLFSGVLFRKHPQSAVNGEPLAVGRSV